MKLTIDTREPWPHPWTPHFPDGTTVERATMETGDLCVSALPDGVCVERKTTADFLAAIGRERARFDLEVKRSRYCGSFAIIVEGTLADVLTANHARGMITTASILGSIAAWTRRGAPVLFAGTQAAAAELAYRMLAGQVKDIREGAKAIARAERVAVG